MATGLNKDQADFVSTVSAATKLDPRVVIAWLVQENADAPGGTGGFNYLNLRPYQGDPFKSVSLGGFEQFANVNDAEIATIRRLNQPFAAQILASTKTARTPAQEISAIAGTGWDAAHYGGPGGPNLVNTFNRLFAGGASTAYLASPNLAGEIAATAGTGSAGNASTFPGASQVSSAVSAVTAPFTSVGDAIKFLFSTRGLEVIGGGALILIGVVSLARDSTILSAAKTPVSAAKAI